MEFIIHSPKYGDKTVLIDDDDKWVLNYKWFLMNQGNIIYIYRFEFKNGKQKTLYLHREIMKAEKGKCVDHINHDTFDNRKLNLRICTNSQNHMNQKLFTNNKTGFKGVSFINKQLKKSRADITLNKKQIYIGCFKNTIDAARAYDKAAIKYFGEFALTNEKLGLL